MHKKLDENRPLINMKKGLFDFPPDPFFPWFHISISNLNLQPHINFNIFFFVCSNFPCNFQISMYINYFYFTVMKSHVLMYHKFFGIKFEFVLNI